MTPEEMANLERIVDWRLARWRDRGDYDDLRQEALIGAWKAIEKTRGSGYELSTIAVHATDHAAREWLRSPKSDLPHYGWRRGYDPPETISLQALAATTDSLTEMDGLSRIAPEPALPDFSDGVVERLQHRAVWVEALGKATPRQAALLRDYYRRGRSQQQIADETGRSWSGVSQLHARAMGRLRAAGVGDEG